MAKKIFVMLIMGLFMMSVVSAVWWNPFTWFDEEVKVTRGEAWVEIFNDNPDFYAVIPNKSKHDADIYLCSKSATKKNDLKDLDFATSFNNKQKDLQTKAKLKPIEYESQYCYYYKPAKNERFLKFDKHSTHFVYTNESIVATQDGVEIGMIGLITENYNYKNNKPNIKVSIGKDQLTHTFYIENLTNESITNLRSINLKNDQEIERNAIMKFLTYEDVEIPTYNENCTTQINQTIVCTEYQNGTTTIQQKKWISKENVTEGEDYIIGVFADVYNGDYIDIDFDYYGTSVLESPIDWASWESSIETNMLAWISLDETSGTTADDSHSTNDGTASISSILDSSVVIKETAGNFGDLTDDYQIEFGTGIGTAIGSGDFSFNVWIKPNQVTSTARAVWFGDASASNNFVQLATESSNIYVYHREGGASGTNLIWESAVANTVYMITYIRDGTTAYLYVNGELEAQGTDTDNDVSLNSKETYLGTANDGASISYGGLLDEFAVWNMAITNETIDLLYNSGDGLGYQEVTSTSPTATLTAPANTTNFTTTNTVNFEYDCNDDVKVDNCTLYINGIVEDLNTSGINGTYYYSTGLDDGYYNWSVGAWNNQSLNGTSDTWFFNVSYVTGIDITLNTPIDTANFTVSEVTFNITAIDNFGIDNVSLWIDGSLNTTDTSQVNGSYQWIRNLPDGSHSWNIEVYDNDSNGVNSSTYNFEIDTTPFIEFLTPPTLVNYANITQEYVPMKVNVSTPYFQNITYSLRNVNGTNYTQFYTAQTFDINFTDIPDAHYHYDVIICTTTDQCNSTEERHINHDTTAPTISSASNLTNLITYSLPINSTWTFNASDTHIDSCYYNTTDHATKTITCNSTETTAWNTAGNKSITFCANDTFGLETCTSTSIIIYYITTSTSDVPDPVIEGSQVQYDLFINELGIGIPTTTAELIHNGTTYPVTLISNNASTYHFQENITILSGLGSLTGQNVSWYWEYDITGLVVDGQTASENTTVFSIEFDNCSNFSDVIVNWTLYDEETSSQVNGTAGSNVELDLVMADPLNEDLFWTFNATWTDIVEGAVCVPTGLLSNDTNYLLDLVFGFDSTDRVWEFYYLDGGTLTDESGFNSLTDNPIILMDLKTADSTSFLFNFFDRDGLPVADSIVHVFRKYIGEGEFREVERSKADQNGDTIVHLVEEDVIYKFLISLDGVQQFISSEYTALCQSTPCEIQIEASGSSAVFPTDWDLVSGGGYLITSEGTTRNVSLTYSFNASDTINLTVYKYNSDGSYSSVGEVSDTGSSGVISLTVPQVAGNVSFFATVDKGGEYIDSEWVDFRVRAEERIGVVLSLFLSALIILTLGLFAVNEGVGTIVYVILGVLISGGLGLMRTELSTGLSVVVYLILIGGLFIWKLTRIRR